MTTCRTCSCSRMDHRPSSHVEGQQLGHLLGPLAIFWDIENCPVPGGVRPDEVASNIRMALQVHPAMKGTVTLFSAYGDFNHFPLRLREGCQRTGVSLLDVPNTTKDASDKAILADMFLFAMDNRPPCTIFLISGDVDFSPALHKLAQRGYSIVLAVSTNTGVAFSLCRAGRFVWDWLSLARGEGLVPAKMYVCRVFKSGGFEEYASNSVNHTREALDDSAPLKGTGGSMPEKDNMNGLKLQLVKLLKLHGGELALGRVRSEFSKLFGRPLYLAEYKALKLSHLLFRMPETFCINGEGVKMTVSLKQGTRNLHAGTQLEWSTSTADKGNGGLNEASVQQNLMGAGLGDCMNEEELLNEHAGYLDQDGGQVSKDDYPPNLQDCTEEAADLSPAAYCQEVRLEIFKMELEELLVCHACRIPVTRFLVLYEQRYAHELDLASLGVKNLETLFEIVKEGAVLEEEPHTRKKYLVVRWS